MNKEKTVVVCHLATRCQNKKCKHHSNHENCKRIKPMSVTSYKDYLCDKIIFEGHKVIEIEATCKGALKWICDNKYKCSCGGIISVSVNTIHDNGEVRTVGSVRCQQCGQGSTVWSNSRKRRNKQSNRN